MIDLQQNPFIISTSLPNCLFKREDKGKIDIFEAHIVRVIIKMDGKRNIVIIGASKSLFILRLVLR